MQIYTSLFWAISLKVSLKCSLMLPWNPQTEFLKRQCHEALATCSTILASNSWLPWKNFQNSWTHFKIQSAASVTTESFCLDESIHIAILQLVIKVYVNATLLRLVCHWRAQKAKTFTSTSLQKTTIFLSQKIRYCGLHLC